MGYRKYIFGLILFVCCPAIASSRVAPGCHAYAQLRHDGHDGWHRQASHRAWGWCMTGWHAYAGSVLEQSDSDSDKLEYGSEEWHQEKKKLNAMLWAGIIIVTILFAGIILVTIIRMGRHYRKRVTGDKKPEPTEYVDAWSQYRLPEDDNDEIN